MTSHMLGGIDIGGTSVKVGVVDAHGRVLARAQELIRAHEQAPALVVRLACSLLEQALAQLQLSRDKLAAVGVGCPGVLQAHGVIHAASNFPSWHDVPLQQLFTDQLHGLRVHVCNDADAAILAEHWVGTAKANVRHFLMLTLGTGVGFGIISDGKLLRGGTNAIEGGHMIVERNGRLCGCSQRGCLEAYSSAGALVLEAQEHVAAGADSTLSAYALEQITAKLIFEHAADGDPMCKRLIAEAADYLGFACVTFCRVLDPEMIVLSGGMAEAGDAFVHEVRSAFAKYAWTKFSNPVKIEIASAGYDSGIIGAVASCRAQLQLGCSTELSSAT